MNCEIKTSARIRGLWITPNRNRSHLIIGQPRWQEVADYASPGLAAARTSVDGSSMSEATPFDPPLQVRRLGALRTRVTHLREQLLRATEAYRKAVARQDAEQFSQLLRARSQLTRQLLKSQSELLLSIRKEHDSNSPMILDTAVVSHSE